MKLFDHLSFPLFSAVLIQVLSQLTKVIIFSLKNRKLTLSYFFSAGGMPSAHSSFVAALTTSLALQNGISSEFFAVSFVFSTIIIYDAFRLRGTVETHSKILDELKKLSPAVENFKINKTVGHSIPEIIVGIISGALFAVVLYLAIGR